MRLSLPVLAACTALALAAPAHAAGLSGMGANLFGNYFEFGKPNLTKPPVTRITAGPLRMELQHTRLAELHKTFGGTLRTQGTGGGIAAWLCYHTDGSEGPAANTWFISNALGGGDFVMIVAVQAAEPKRIPADCDAAPAKFALPDLGIPGLGASSAELKAAFGTASSGSKLAYRVDVPAADALGTALTAQYLGYLTKGGKVTAYGAGETAIANIK
jgi:hypothetical protein